MLETAETASSAPTIGRMRLATVADCMFLSTAALLPVIPYIRRLGFYADDWGLFALYRAEGAKTFSDCFRIFYSLGITHQRPVEVFYKAVLFRIFGTHALGFHVVNSVVFVASACLLYLSLRLILRERLLAVSIPLIFVLLPNYSSARFVPFAFMVGLSMPFFFLNLYSLLKAAEGTALWTIWTVVSMIGVLISGLAYEVALPLFVLSGFIVWHHHHHEPAGARARPHLLEVILLLNAATLSAVLLFKAFSTTRYHGVVSLTNVVNGSLEVHFYELGIRLPLVVLKVILRFWNPGVFTLAALTGVVTFWYLRRIARQSNIVSVGLGRAFALLAVAVVIFAGGNAIFVVSQGETGYTATGVENRTAIAASLGMAVVFSGAVMCITALAKRQRETVSSLLFAILVACFLLLTCTIGTFWARAAEQQEAILRSIHQVLPTLPPNTTLLVRGLCPYLGPGIVFEGPGDMGGALQLLYQDPTLLGDVVTPRLTIKPHAIQSRIYQSFHYYPYGPNLKLYDLRPGTVQRLSDADAARQYLGITGPSYSFCPEGEEAYGVDIF